MAETNPVRILSSPGIKRDGTRLEGDGYIDGQWVRFDRGLPRKMGGYRSVNRFLYGPPRTIEAYTRDGLVYLHFGSYSKIERLTVDQGLNSSLIYDRTPGTLDVHPDNLWQFTVDTSNAGAPLIVAQVAPNLQNITNSFGGQLFTGGLFATIPLTEVTLLPAGASLTGGVFALHPYTVIFGNLGWVGWSVPGNPSDYVGSGAGNANVTRQKIVFGMPLRGGGDGPSALLWSADSLIRMTYQGPDASGGGPTFAFDTLSVHTSIMSSSGVVEQDGIYYWAGTDRFLMFNGVVREIPNLFNKDFFFDEINWEHRQKVFAFKIPRWGEIWWCFPLGSSTEPNHAIIYNIRENIWYDTPLPGDGRSAGISPGVFRYPASVGITPGLFAMETATVDNAGTGYTAGDHLTVVGGAATDPAVVEVLTVDGGGSIITASIFSGGSYTTPPVSPVDMGGGTGTGATFDTTFAAPRKLWIHEVGTDEVDGTLTIPVLSFFETADVSLPIDKGMNNQTRVVYIEPDFVQSGPMTVQVRGNANARAPDVLGPEMVFPDVATTVNEEIVFLKDQKRQLRFRFTSNALGGNYLMGVTLAHVGAGDGTLLG